MGVRIEQATREFTYDGATYPKGTWVIPMDQEFAELVRELFEVQHYPDLGEDQPYDAAGWTLPFQMDVNVIAGKTPLSSELRSALAPVHGTAVDWHTAPDAPFTTNAEAAGIVPLPGRITGTGDALVLDPAQNNSFRLIARVLAAKGTVRVDEADSAHGGRYIVSGVPMTQLERWAKELSLDAERTTDAATSGAVTASARIALYKASPGIIDEGWTEWMLDTYGFPYTIITPADLRAGNLHSRFDVLVLASQGLTNRRFGRRGGRGGAPVDTAAEAAAVRGVDDFVRDGGTIVVWSQGVNSAIDELHLPVKDVVAGLRMKDYFTGISIMQVTTDTAHPVMAGMPAQADIVVNRSPVLTTLDGFDGAVLARYAQEGSPLRSGWLNGAKYMAGGAAAVDVKHGDGHAVLIAFQPQWRGQSTATFRVVFNSLFFTGDVAAHAKGTPGFWTAPVASPAGTGNGR
jgi:hypothetical protein